ncbi:RT0821/Lpp0805 family surface protein [Mesorhizobium sp. BE184]|uniref:RT0821/Lpp0805 family surface protein n=1 Tax=Mesorhizobium sp. BE184 TaxID=2817714 RepID=UPI00285436E0|nr:RT0821/Lpp0805 family surface protein [Mesorhizobium sp. BE184]MDR7031591.1 hypothetical protein [Mesorhizobium sp. BE184]
MPRIAQTLRRLRDGASWATSGTVLFFAVLQLTGCGVGGFSLDKAEVDHSILTSATPAAETADANFTADQATIRNAVSSADIESLGGKAIPWANPGTGSRGSINELAETKDTGVLCRRFSASRESFDGVAMFYGRACLISEGAWRLDEFKAL